MPKKKTTTKSKSVKKRVAAQKEETLGVASTPEVVDVYQGKSLGITTILSSTKIELNGRDFFKLKLSNNTETILSEKDLEKQAK